MAREIIITTIIAIIKHGENIRYYRAGRGRETPARRMDHPYNMDSTYSKLCVQDAGLIDQGVSFGRPDFFFL